MKLDELESEVKELRGMLKDYNKAVQLFSEDETVKTLARINQLMCRIEFLIKLSGIKEVEHPKDKPVRSYGKPCMVRVSPCGEKFGGKTYFGYLTGSGALSSSVGIEEDKIVCNWSFMNPMIYIPELGEIVFGAESWWGEIKSAEDLADITPDDINSVWYVQLMKKFSEEAGAKAEVQE